MASFFDDEVCSHEYDEDENADEIPPFALPEEDLGKCGNTWPAAINDSNYQHHHHADSMLHVTQSATSQPPALASSVLSCQTEESTHQPSTINQTGESSIWENGNLSLMQGDMLLSRHLEAAASLIANMEVTGYHPPQIPATTACSSHQTHHSFFRLTRPNRTDRHPSEAVGSFSSMEFSRLLQNADDNTTEPPDALSILPEEPDRSTQSESFHSARGASSILFPSNIPSTTSQIISSDWVQVDSSPSHIGYCPPSLPSQYLDAHSTSRSGWSIVEQSALRKTGVSAKQLDPTSFEVIIDISPTRSSVESVMEVLGNPAYLVLWYESIRSLVITNSSEGTRSADSRTGINANSNGQLRAEYEGEWIEATTTDLISPPSASSCFYSTSKAFWNHVGFPSNYGTISMFVERLRGRVGLSIGPFAGDVTVSHAFTVQITGDAIRIVDKVTLSKGTSSTELLCGVFECVESCFLPSVKGYMDQTVSSLMRLRVLLETGERRQNQ